MLIFAICQKAASARYRSGTHCIVGDNDAISLHICLLFSKNDPPCECGCVHVCCVKTGAATAGGNRRQSPWTTSSLITAHPLIFISRQTDIWNTSGSAGFLYNLGNLIISCHINFARRILGWEENQSCGGSPRSKAWVHHPSNKPWTTEGFQQMIWQMRSSPSLLGYCFEVRISAVIFHEQECLQGKEIERVQSSLRISLQCCTTVMEEMMFSLSSDWRTFCQLTLEAPTWTLLVILKNSFSSKGISGTELLLSSHSLFYRLQ